MYIFVNKIHYPVRNLGFGTRLGIWLQGCPIRCSGCVNPETWDFAPEYAVRFETLAALLENYRGEPLDGVTITGGEPFAQPDALRMLASYLRTFTEGDLLVYSGYTLGRLRRRFADTLAAFDVAVSGPYIESMPDRLIWRGSDNQRITLLTEKARRIYPPAIDRARWEGRRMQISIVDGSAYMVGIPARGDMERLYEKLRARGVECRRPRRPPSS